MDIHPLPTDAPYFDLGDFHRTITTNSASAQIWFDRGLTWTYCFNHEEACLCFRQVILHDPACAMGYWGLAFALGPNYNKTWGVFDKHDLRRTLSGCHRMSRKALDRSHTASPVERSLIHALQYRYPSESVPSDFSDANKAYADAMRLVYNDFGQDDLDVATLFVDALMSWKPRQMYRPTDGQPIPTSPVFEVKRILEECLQRPGADRHPGAPHLYVHLMEMSATPEVAVPAADMIRHLIPDAGHMAHMPSHLDILVGEYGRAIDANQKATLADDRYFAIRGGVNFYSYYRLHDYHSLVYAAMLAARPTLAFETLDRLEATITEDMLLHKSPPMANWLEFFLSVRVHALIRFGRWAELKAMTIPQNRDMYCVTTVMRYYGKAIAHAATGDIDQAEKEQLNFALAATRVPESRVDYPNKIVDILKVAQHMLDGELEYRRGNHRVAFVHLREAISHEDSLKYTEPWGWMLPARHAYGALSLEQGAVEQAAQAYAEDLGIRKALTRAHAHPKNVWALHGYHECMVRLGRDAEAREIKTLLDKAQTLAEVDVSSSCYCRLGDGKACC